ncbi:hypothetical protein LCGC14_2819260 [marine sediment metagenome]|uniref:Uncharacterized protein n=1 Tax=marine sediment metagenome TaxID=412755 RepID=A0A0F8YHI9_9ZZZZ
MPGKKGPYDMPVNDDWTPEKEEEKTKSKEGEFQKLASRVSQLEGLVESLLTVTHSLNKYRETNNETVARRSDQILACLSGLKNTATLRERDIREIGELQRKLKETIVAVEKLAKGKSLGALGLPPLESWDPPK